VSPQVVDGQCVNYQAGALAVRVLSPNRPVFGASKVRNARHGV
jgi:hypothetical protein